MEYKKRKSTIAKKRLPNPSVSTRRSSTTFSIGENQKHKNKKVLTDSIDKKVVICLIEDVLHNIKSTEVNEKLEKISFRDDESAMIRDYIKSSIDKDVSDIDPSFLIIFGQPGLGKTRLVTQIIEDMQIDYKGTKKKWESQIFEVQLYEL